MPRASGLRRAEDRPGDQERTAELLVGRDGDRGEAVGRRPLGRGDEQPRLADPGLTLDGEADEPAGAGRRELLGDRLELGRPPDHVAGRPVNVEGHRREGQRSVVVRDHVVSAGSGSEGSRDPALRHASERRILGVAGIAGVGQSLARFPKDPEPAKGCR